MNVRLGIIGEFTPTFEPHRSTNDAIAHVLACEDRPLSVDWLSSADVTADLLTKYAGLWVAPGSPYEDSQKTVTAIQWARENNIPCLGTCRGFQHMVIEYARNLLGFEDAQHGEYDPYASDLFTSELECSLAGREMVLTFDEESRVADIYGMTDRDCCESFRYAGHNNPYETTEEYYCNFGVNPEHLNLFIGTFTNRATQTAHTYPALQRLWRETTVARISWRVAEGSPYRKTASKSRDISDETHRR